MTGAGLFGKYGLNVGSVAADIRGQDTDLRWCQRGIVPESLEYAIFENLNFPSGPGNIVHRQAAVVFYRPLQRRIVNQRGAQPMQQGALVTGIIPVIIH